MFPTIGSAMDTVSTTHQGSDGHPGDDRAFVERGQVVSAAAVRRMKEVTTQGCHFVSRVTGGEVHHGPRFLKYKPPGTVSDGKLRR